MGLLVWRVYRAACTKWRLSDLRKVFCEPEPAESNIWPPVGELVLVAVLALIITAVDIYFSIQIGLLAYPPYYDGIGYVLSAKSLFYRLRQLRIDPLSYTNALLPSINPYAPLWQALMLTSFFLIGEGEWQAYTVRFWPTFLLLLLTLWVIRRRTCRQVIWIAVTFTSLLPTISVGLRASVWEYFAGSTALSSYSSSIGLQWYLADLRPDLLFSVLLLWTIVPLIECVHDLDRRIWLISGTSSGLAVLVKSSMSPILLFAWALTITYVLAVNGHRLRLTVLTSLWSLLPFAMLVTPWALVGGARSTWEYLYVNFTVQSAFYSNVYPTFLSEATYYWNYFPTHIGNLEGWTILVIGLALSLFSFCKRTGRKDSRIIAYLGTPAALYILLSVASNKNYFAGLSYYLLLWLFSWTVLASFLRTRACRNRIVSSLLLLILCMYAGFYVVAGFYSLQNVPMERRLAIQENKRVTQEIAMDLRSFLTNNDRFMWAPAYGFPAALQYYMVDKEGRYPQWIWIGVEKSPDQTIRESVSTCKAVLAYEEDIDEVARFMYVHPLYRPYFRAIAEWVKQPNSSYASVRTYYFITEGGRLTLDLYLKQSNSNSIVVRESEVADKEMNSPIFHCSPQTVHSSAKRYHPLIFCSSLSRLSNVANNLKLWGWAIIGWTSRR